MKCPFEISYEKVTPATAGLWLKDHNTHNRPLREPTVSAFASDMKSGRWFPNHQGIAFSNAGVLLDGQHRLSAVVASGVTIHSLVFRNVPDRVEGVSACAMDTIDRGNARSLADLLKLEYGVRSEPNFVAAACLHFARLCVPQVSQARKATMPQTVAVLQQFGEAIQWIVPAKPTNIGLRNVIVAGTLAFAWPVAKKGTAAFLEKLVSGAGLAADSPALVLRNAVLQGLIDQHGSAEMRLQTARVVLECLRADLRGEKFMRLPKAGDALQWFRAQQTERVATIAALFPFVDETAARRAKKAELKRRRAELAEQTSADRIAPTSRMPASDAPTVKAGTFNVTAAAARLLAKAGR